MAFKRRFRKRNIKKRFKRRFRKMSLKRTKMTSYDGIYYAKLHTIASITADNLTPTNGSMMVGWGLSGISGPGEVFIDDNAEWVSLVAHFRNWRLLGMKIEVYPRVDSTEATSGMFNVLIASSPTGLLTASSTDAVMLLASDYKEYTGRSGTKIKRFYRLGKFYKSMAEIWLPNTTTYVNPGSTLVRIKEIGYASGATVGRIHVTWYTAHRQYLI